MGANFTDRNKRVVDKWPPKIGELLFSLLVTTDNECIVIYQMSFYYES